MANIQLPVLFDMSGDTIVFGEDGTGDFLNSHLDFILDMTTEANGISLTAADISSSILVGDQDTGDSIFYSGGTSGNIGVDNLCNRIAKAITRGKLVHLPKTGNTSNSGIPMGGRANLYDLNGVWTENGNNDIYAIKYFSSIAPIGDEQMLGEAMARVASVHLVGSPLSAGIFQDKTQVQTDLETPSSHTFDGGNTAFYNALAVQLSKVLGGSKSSAPMNNGGGSGGSDLASQLYYESFDNEDVTFHANADIVYVDGIGGSGKAMSTIGQSPAGFQWVQKVSDGSLPSNVRAVSFHIKFVGSQFIFDNGWNDGRALFFSQFKLKFKNGSATSGDPSGSGYLPTGTQPTIWYDGAKTMYSNITNSAIGALVLNGDGTDIHNNSMNDGNWHHFYIEYPDGETLPDEFSWLANKNGDGASQGSIDDLRYFNAALTPTQIADLAAGNNGTAGMPVGYPLDASGTSVPALKSIFEQLMNVPGRALLVSAEDQGDGGDVTGQTTPDPASLGNTVSTISDSNTTTNTILGITVMPNGDIYASGRNTHNIYKITAAGVLSEYTSDNGQTNVDGTIGVDAVTIPTGYGICNDGTSLYICCWYYHVVKKVNLYTGVVSTLAGTFGTASTGEDSNFNKPSGICIDSAKENLYVAEWQTGRIKKINISTGAVTFIAGGAGGQWLGTGSAAGFWRPTTIAIDSTDTYLWISNREGNLSKLEISTGEATIPGFATNGGVGTNGSSVYTLTPQETTDYRTIAIDPSDTYIYYCTPHKVRRWNISTETVEDFAGHGTETGLVEGSLTDARFDMSFGEYLVLAFDNEWNIYIAHRSSHGGGKTAISRINQIGGGSPQDILSKPTTKTSGFPFITGDKLVVYLRPKIVFATQTFPEQHSESLVGFPDTVGFNVPVYNIADSTGSITSQTYSESSSQGAGWGFAAAVDGTGVAGQPYFTTAGGTYNNTTGVHEGAGQTTNVDGSTTLDGEWGQVDIGVNTFVKELALTTNNTYNFRSPTEFRLLGSADGTNWKTMIHETGIATWLDDTPRTYQNLVATPYRYYRYVVITIDSVHGNSDLRTSLGHFNLKGSLTSEASIRVGGKAAIPGFQPIAQAVQDISGLVTNFTATAQNIQDAFPGKSIAGDESEPLKWGWVGSANSDSLTLDTTDMNDPTSIDLHIWKITITL